MPDSYTDWRDLARDVEARMRPGASPYLAQRIAKYLWANGLSDPLHLPLYDMHHLERFVTIYDTAQPMEEPHA